MEMKSRLWDVTYDTGKQYKVVAKTVEEAIIKSRNALPPDMAKSAHVISINAVCEIDIV